MTHRTRPSIAAAALLTGLVLVMTGAPAASAHTSLISSSPEDGAVLPSAPTEVALTFDEDLLPGADVMALTDAQGNVIVTQPVTPDGPTVRLPWPPGLPAGEYQIGYRVVSGDGHPVDGAIVVTVNASSGAASPAGDAAPSASAGAATATATAPGDAAGIPAAPLWLGALVIVAAGAGVVLVARRPRSP